MPGKPLLYGTTDEFLRCFGLESLDQLPELGDESAVISAVADDNMTVEELETE